MLRHHDALPSPNQNGGCIIRGAASRVVARDARESLYPRRPSIGGNVTEAAGGGKKIDVRTDSADNRMGNRLLSYQKGR